MDYISIKSFVKYHKLPLIQLVFCEAFATVIHRESLSSYIYILIFVMELLTFS